MGVTPPRGSLDDHGTHVAGTIGAKANNGGVVGVNWNVGLISGKFLGRRRILSDRTGPSIPWSVAGPTCDSVDILMRDEMLPEDIREGDFIYIPNAGAYTTAYASNFNGFPLPEVIVL